MLVVRVHELVPRSVWSKRYDQINDFERTLAENGTTIVKFFLSISKDEQRERFQARYDDPTKRWKFSMADLSERERWDDYQARSTTRSRRRRPTWAPWYVIPANRKWFRNLAGRSILADTIAGLRPAYPPVAGRAGRPRHRLRRRRAPLVAAEQDGERLGRRPLDPAHLVRFEAAERPLPGRRLADRAEIA